MPFIHVRTNVRVDDSAKSKRENLFGKAISLLPGKSQEWLMTRIEDDCRMTFSGSDEPLRRIKVSVYKETSGEGSYAIDQAGKDYDGLTGKLTDIVSSLLPIRKDRIYVSYFETPYWGYNGSDF